jgi:O-antigen/teichoic acid export membrane protein
MTISFVRDVFTLQIGKIVYMGLTLISSILFARMLGVEAYGIYAVVLAFVSTTKTFLNISQSGALQVFLAEAYGRGDTREMGRVLKNFLNVSLLNTIVLLSLAIGAIRISTLFYENETIGTLARVLFIFTAIDAVNSAVLIVLQAVRRITLKAVLEQSAIALWVTLSAVALFLGFGVMGVIGAQLLASTCMVPISIAVLVRVGRQKGLPSLSDVLRIPTRETSTYFTQGLWYSLDKNLGNLYPSGLFFILSLVALPESVGIARIALQLASLPLSFLLPQVTELSATVLANFTRDRIDHIRSAATKIIRASMIIHAVVSVGAILTFPVLIRLFYGEAYVPAIPITLWLIVLALPSPLCTLNSPLLRLWRRTDASALLTAIMAITMWTVIYTLSSTIGALPGFLVAFAVGQFMPLIVTLILFQWILRPHASPNVY